MEKLGGVYLGKVLQHMTHGYCKIMIYGVYPSDWEKTPELLPKAAQASPLFAGTCNGNGTFSYPNVGSTVWCMFANGDQNFPVYWAAALGGQNAFGQFELIKSPNEEQSSKHLLTSGKTQIEIFESGKLSSLVQTPDTRAADVEFNNTEIGYLSADTVISRPQCTQILSNQISTINCQFVQDVALNVGEISASTYSHYPVRFQSAYISDDKNRTVLSDLQIDDTFNTYRKHSNSGNIDDAISAGKSSSYNFTDLNLSARTNLTIVSSNADTVSNDMHLNADGTRAAKQANQSDYQLVSSYIQLNEQGYPRTIAISNVIADCTHDAQQDYSNKGSMLNCISVEDHIRKLTSFMDVDKSIQESLAEDDDLLSVLTFKNDASSAVNESQIDNSRKVVESVTNASKAYVKTLTDSIKNGNHIGYVANDCLNAFISADMKQTETIVDDGSLISITEKNKRDARIQLSCDYGNTFARKKDYKRDETRNGQTVGLTSIVNQSFEQTDAGMSLIADKLEKRKSGSTEKDVVNSDVTFQLRTDDPSGIQAESNNNKTKIHFHGNVDTTTGIVDLKIQNLQTGKFCQFKFTANGDLSFETSNSIDIKTKAMTVSTQQLIALQSKAVSVKGQAVSIMGTAGDCRIANVSLLNHKHLETQTGDVVYPQSSVTAKGSN